MLLSTLIYSILFMALVCSSFAAFLFYLRNRAARTAPLAKHRGMFQFNDGLALRYVDPIDVIMALESHPEYRFDLHPKAACAGNVQAIKIQSDAIKQAFGVTDFTSPDKPGLTVQEQTQLLYAFWQWVELQKKSTEPLPISAPSMVQETSTSSGDATQTHTSDSGSTSTLESVSTP